MRLKHNDFIQDVSLSNDKKCFLFLGPVKNLTVIIVQKYFNQIFETLIHDPSETVTGSSTLRMIKSVIFLKLLF